MNPRSVIDIDHEIAWHEERLVELKKERALSFNIFDLNNKGAIMGNEPEKVVETTETTTESVPEHEVTREAHRVSGEPEVVTETTKTEKSTERQ